MLNHVYFSALQALILPTRQRPDHLQLQPHTAIIGFLQSQSQWAAAEVLHAALQMISSS